MSNSYRGVKGTTSYLICVILLVLSVLTITACPGLAGKTYKLTVNFSYTEEPTSGEAHWKLSTEDAWRDSGDNVNKLNPNSPYTINIQVPDGYDHHDDVDIWIGTSNWTEEILISKSGGTGVSNVTGWPLWPTSPTGYEGSIVFDPLSFTIVGGDRKLLSWAKPIPHDVFFWNGNLFLSDLDAGVVNDAISSGDVVFGSRNLQYSLGSDSTGSSLSGISVSVLQSMATVPEYVEHWQIVNSKDISNQYFPHTGNWTSFLEGKKGSSNAYLGDPGHASAVLVWPENIWLEQMSGYAGGDHPYKDFLNDVWSSDIVGDALLCLSTNEGFVHGFGTEPFSEKWALIPVPALQHALYQKHLWSTNGDTHPPRLNLLDGPLGFGDIESEQGTWRRIIVGSSGSGMHLVNKPEEAWTNESGDIHTSDVDQMIPSYSRNNPHAWGMYAVKIAENDDGTGDGTGPGSPKVLWSVSNNFWEELSGDVTLDKRVLAVNDTVMRDNSNIRSSNYAEYSDILLSNCRPVVGLTGSGDYRQWHVIFAAIDRDENFHLYDVDANTGAILQVIPLGKPPYIAMNGLFDPETYSEPSEDPNAYNFDGIWDPAFEWKFPTRMAAVAKDTVRDNDPSDLSSVQLDRRPLLKEVYVHLSNGALYQWNVSESPSSTNPRLIMVNSYGYSEDELYDDEYEGHVVAGPSTQDMDATYLLPLQDSITDEYHRFVALAVKGGKKPKGDLRALVVLDIDKIIADNNVLSIDERHYGHGNKDRVDYLENYEGWFTLLAGGDASDGKYWNEGIAISAPVFSNGRLILATYQPDTNTSHVYNTLARPEDKAVIVENETAYVGTEFAGGATLTLNEEGEAVIYVGTIDGGIISQDLPEASWLQDVSAPGLSGPAEVLYWKVR